MTPEMCVHLGDKSRAEIIAEHIQQVVDAMPPLTAEQIEKLRGLLPYPHPGATDRQPAA